MNLPDIGELHYITHIDNVESIIEFGILSRLQAKLRRIDFKCTSERTWLEDSARLKTSDGLPLSHYVNLFLNARNLTLRRRVDRYGRSALCVLRVDLRCLTDGAPGLRPDAFVCCDHPSSRDAEVVSLAEGLRRIGRNEMLGPAKCKPRQPEILIHEQVEARHLRGAYVGTPTALKEFDNDRFPVATRRQMFDLP